MAIGREWGGEADRILAFRKALALLMPIALILPLLFVVQLEGLGPILFLLFLALSALTLAWIPFPRLVQLWPLLLVAGFAIASVLWSIAPVVTLRLSLQLAFTILAGIIIGSSPWPARSLTGVWAAYAIFILSSIAFGKSVALGAQQETAFAGLNGGKNYLGDMTAIALLTTFGAIGVALRQRRAALFAGGVVLVLAGSYVLFAARSSGAILGLAIATVVFLFLLVMGYMRGGMKALTLAILLVVGATGVVVTATQGPALRAALLQVMGKDDTLTGRVYLWYRAETYLRERPWLGTGYGAFWVQGQADAEGLWAYSEIPSRSGFNFHNTAMEQRINLGWIGFLLIAAVSLGCIAMLCIRFFVAPSVECAFWTALMAYELSRVSYEAIGPTPFNMGTVVMSAALAFGCAAWRRNASRPASRGD